MIVNETDTNGTNNSELEGTTVRVRADLSIAKTPSINPVQLRQPFDWSVVVTNNGPGDSQTTSLSDTCRPAWSSAPVRRPGRSAAAAPAPAAWPARR